MSMTPRILVVEDERIVAAALQKRLGQLGYDVVALAHAGEDAVRLAESLRPNLVLMDIQLEGPLDGIAAAARIRLLDIPVVYLTAFSNAEMLERAKVTEPLGYILKPYEERELHIVVEMALYKHRCERDLHERQRWLAAVLASIGDGVLATDNDGRVTFLNPVAEQLTGWPTAEAQGKELDDVLHLVDEESRQPVESPLRRAMRERVHVPLANHTLLIARDQSERPIDDCATPIADRAGTALGGVMVFRDISDRRRAQTELLLRDRAMQAVSQGILITDPNLPDNPIIYASPGFLRMSGYAAHEVLGKNPRFLQGPDTDPETVAHLRAAVRASQPTSVEILNYRKDSTPFWNAVSIYPVRDDGRVTHLIGVQVDITDRRRLEAQYRQAQKMEAIGRLAGGIAHDFNNLLTVINGFSQVVIGMLHPHDKARDMVEEIAKAGERAAGLTQQLLAYSRKQLQQLQVFKLNDMLARSEKMLRRLLGEDIEVVIVAEPGLRPVKADPGQLEQVVMNLCVNARDAMPRGGSLTIEMRNVQFDDTSSMGAFQIPAGPYVLLAVSDTGIGMDAQTQAHLFEPFFTTKPEGHGTGLGLATVYGIVKQSDGYITVYSEVDQGTTFKIYLPSLPEPGSSSASVDNPPQARGGTETVLIVEDEASVRALTELTLKEHGYNVLVASSGAEAIQLAATHRGPIDLLVSDVVMPKMSGRQLAETLAATRPALKVLYLSGYTDDTVFRHGVLEAETTFLAKPFSLSALARSVRELLDRPAPAAPSSS